MDTITWMIRFNEWWKTSEVRKELKKEKHRNLFEEILPYLNDHQIISLIGLRRTGKTTLMYQLIDHLIKNGVPPKNILYFSFDEILSADPNILEEVIENYQKMILKTEEKTYLFLDEIQYIEKWQAVLKRYYDLHPTMKFFISGSASLNIKKAKESLAGRIYEFVLHPLSFREFLDMKTFPLPKKQTTYTLEELQHIYHQLLPYKDDIETHLNEYMLKGGFPELIEEKSLEKIQKYLRTNIDKIIFQDIPKVFDIKEPALLLELLKITAAQSGTILEYEGIGNALKTTRQSISNYMLYLQESFLIRKITNYTGSALASARKAKKFYIQDHGITNTLLEKHEEAFSEQDSGKIIENIIVNTLQPTYFWRQNYEVDVVLKTNEITPIEIKYRTDPTDIKGLEKFMELYGTKKGIVISKTLLKQTQLETGEILFIPAWLFLLLY
jgi:hypothetical protein